MHVLEVSCSHGTKSYFFTMPASRDETCICRVEKLGYKLPQFDFRVHAVTSMSADIHKYGFGLKVKLHALLHPYVQLQSGCFTRVQVWCCIEAMISGNIRCLPTQNGQEVCLVPQGWQEHDQVCIDMLPDSSGPEVTSNHFK